MNVTVHKKNTNKRQYTSHTVETRIKEPTFLGNNLLKALIFCLYNPYIKDGGGVSLIKTCKDCISITVAFYPTIYFTFKLFLSKCYSKFQSWGSYDLGSSMRVPTVCILI